MKRIEINGRVYYAIITLIFTIALMSLASANLGTFQQGKCLSIRVLANSSLINLTEVTANQNITYVINSPMTLLGGQTFNYTFCNTSQLGEYSYSWNNPNVDCSNEDCGNNFMITPNGYTLTTSTGIIYFLIIGSLIFLFLFILEKSIRQTLLGWQVGLMLISYLVLLSSSFVFYNLAYNYLYDLPFLSNILNYGWITLGILTMPVFLIALMTLLFNQVNQLRKERKNRFDNTRNEARG